MEEERCEKIKEEDACVGNDGKRKRSGGKGRKLSKAERDARKLARTEGAGSEAIVSENDATTQCLSIFELIASGRLDEAEELAIRLDTAESTEGTSKVKSDLRRHGLNHDSSTLSLGANHACNPDVHQH